MKTRTRFLLFTDQAEYYFVCSDCYHQFYDMQWSGSTNSFPEWMEVAQNELKHYQIDGLPCQFCGPEGNGGWMIDGKFPAAERRDSRKTG